MKMVMCFEILSIAFNDSFNNYYDVYKFRLTMFEFFMKNIERFVDYYLVVNLEI